MSITFSDRASTYPNRYKVTPENGEPYYVTLERADEPTALGTPLNASTLNELVSNIDGKIGVTKVWEEEPPEDGYGESMFLVDLSQYDGVMIGFKVTVSGELVLCSGFIPRGSKTRLFYVSTDGEVYWRAVEVGDSEIVLETGHKGSTAGENYAIPVAVYAWKGIG